MTAEYKHEYMKFQSTPSARRATDFSDYIALSIPISIHALREESDETASIEKIKI